MTSLSCIFHKYRLFPFLGKIATIGVSRTVTDSSELKKSPIARKICEIPGDTEIDSDLVFGLASFCIINSRHESRKIFFDNNLMCKKNLVFKVFLSKVTFMTHYTAF